MANRSRAQSSKPQRVGSKQRYSIAAILVCVSLNAVGLSMALPLLSLVLEQHGVSGLAIGLIAAMSGIATLLASPFAATLVHRFGVLAMLIASIAISALSFLAFHWADSLWLWFILRFINGAALALTLVTSEFWINALVGPNQRGFITGLYAATQSLGLVAGPILLAVVGPHGLTPFAVATAVTLLAVVPALMGAGIVPEMEEPPRKRAIMAFLFLTPIATLAAFVFGAIEGGMNLLPVYALHTGHGERTAILLATAIALGNLVLQMPLSILSDRIDRRKVLFACGVIALVSAFIIPVSTGSAWSFFGFVLVWGGAVAGLYSVGLALLEGGYTGAKLASANAAFVMLYSAGRLIGPPIVGAGIDFWNPHGFAVAMALFPALYLVVVIITWRSSRPTIQRTSAI